NSKLCGDMLAIFGGMGGLSYVRPGITVTLPIVAEGKHAEVALTSKVDPLNPVARFMLMLDEIAALYVLLRAFCVAWQRFCAMTVGFFVFVSWFNPGQYFAFYAMLQAHPPLLLIQEILQALAQGAGYAGFLIFALRFPHDRTEDEFVGIERGALALVPLHSDYDSLIGTG
ncbi:MAG TPA: hypothetical protein VMH05_26835, partial [Bryobacteraceae bacterium]|nr:hypothetical protein [Bryobacteraceae bacterium]